MRHAKKDEREEQEMKRALKTAFIALAGACIGYIIGSIAEPERIYGYVIFFMGFPFGWSFLSRHIGTLISTNFALMATVFLIKVVLSGIIGWVILPVEIVMSVVEVLSKGKE